MMSSVDTFAAYIAYIDVLGHRVRYYSAAACFFWRGGGFVVIVGGQLSLVGACQLFES